MHTKRIFASLIIASSAVTSALSFAGPLNTQELTALKTSIAQRQNELLTNEEEALMDEEAFSIQSANGPSASNDTRTARAYDLGVQETVVDMVLQKGEKFASSNCDVYRKRLIYMFEPTNDGEQAILPPTIEAMTLLNRLCQN